MRTAGRWPPLMLTRPARSCEIFCDPRVGNPRASAAAAWATWRGVAVGCRPVHPVVDRRARQVVGRKVADALIAACASWRRPSRKLEAELQRDDAPPELVDDIWFGQHPAGWALERRRDRRRRHVRTGARIEGTTWIIGSRLPATPRTATAMPTIPPADRPSAALSRPDAE